MSPDLFRLSNTDALTGLANRRCIDETLLQFWLDWTERRQAFAAVLVDVDFFKRFNDARGHQAGDACLVKVARTLDQVLEGRPGLVGRYGGEEFIALLRCESEDEALGIAQAMRRAVEDLGLKHGNRPDDGNNVTVSLGVTFTRGSGATDPEAIVALADQGALPRQSRGAELHASRRLRCGIALDAGRLIRFHLPEGRRTFVDHTATHRPQTPSSSTICLSILKPAADAVFSKVASTSWSSTSSAAPQRVQMRRIPWWWWPGESHTAKAFRLSILMTKPLSTRKSSVR